MHTKLFEYEVLVEQSNVTKLKLSSFCRDWPSFCWVILRVNKLIQSIPIDNIIATPWIRAVSIILFISILATFNFIRMRRRRNKQQELESKLQQEERKRDFDKLVDDMLALRTAAATKEEDPKSADEFFSNDSLSDSKESLWTAQLMEVSPQKTGTGSAKSKNKAVKFRDGNAKTATRNNKKAMLSSGDGPKQLNDLGTKKGIAVNKTNRSALKPPKKPPTPNITAPKSPKPVTKVGGKGNSPQTRAGSSKVPERPIWRL